MGNGGGMGTGYAHPIHIHGTHFYVMKVINFNYLNYLYLIRLAGLLIMLAVLSTK